MMKIAYSFFFLFLQISLLAQLNLVPYPAEVSTVSGQFDLSSEGTIYTNDSALSPIANLLIQDFKKITDFDFTETPSSGDINLAINPDLDEEEYILNIGSSINITGQNYEAVVMGATTLLQLHSSNAGVLSFPQVEITDKPKNHFRSLMIDVARQFNDISTLKHAVELCRFYKVRYLQIHFSDNEAFTFPSTHYPEIVSSTSGYTLDEMNDLADYAETRGVGIIPEIDGPGHSQAIRSAKPDVFGSAAYSVLDMTSDTMYAAMAIILEELNEVFDPPYFHIGADEAFFNSAYANAPQVVGYMNSNNYNEEDMKREFVQKMDLIVKSFQKKTMAWESFKANNAGEAVQIPNDILVNAWETLYEHPQNYIDQGFDVINTSWKPYYTTRHRRWHPEYIYDFGKYSFANHWIYAPSYNQFDIPPTDLIKGGQMCAWEQFDAQQVEGMRNRIPAFSESFWLEEDRPGFEDYHNRFTATDQLFTKLLCAATVQITGNYTPASIYEGDWKGEALPNPSGDQTNFSNWFSESVTVTIEALMAGAEIHYTVDGSEPDINSALYTETLTFTESTHLKFISFVDGQNIGYQQYIFEHRPIIAHLDGINMNTREPETSWYKKDYIFPLTIAFDPIADDVEIHYTLNNSTPGSFAPLYENPIELTSTNETVVRARAFKNGQPYGEEWRPVDYYDFIQINPGSQHYRFSGVDPMINLTTFKPITVSTFPNPSFPKEFANDGLIDMHEHWAGGPDFPQQLVIDLEAVHNLNSFKVWTYWGGNRFYRYHMDVSVDSVEWVPVVNYDNPTGVPASPDGIVHDFEATLGRYIRLVMDFNNNNQWSHVVEVWAFEEPLDLSDPKNRLEVSVFPNPTDGKVFFSLPEIYGTITLEIFNNEGKLLRSEKVANNEMDIKTLPAGFYYFKFKSSDGKVGVKKIQKM